MRDKEPEITNHLVPSLGTCLANNESTCQRPHGRRDLTALIKTTLTGFGKPTKTLSGDIFLLSPKQIRPPGTERKSIIAIFLPSNALRWMAIDALRPFPTFLV
jgi:hypothetical protein